MKVERIFEIGRAVASLAVIVRDLWRAQRTPPVRIDALDVGAVMEEAVRRERDRARARFPEDGR